LRLHRGCCRQDNVATAVVGIAGDAAATGDGGDVAEAVVAQTGDRSFRVSDAGQVLGGVATLLPPFAKGGKGGFTTVAKAATTGGRINAAGWSVSLFDCQRTG